MFENQTSIRTKKQNMLKTKVQTFQSTYQQSESRMKSKSSLHNLAGKLYSSTYNKEFKEYASPKKGQPRPSSAKKNPQKQKQQAISGLEMRASHVGSYAEVIPNLRQINTKLLKQKKDLEMLIADLKQKIVQQKKKLNNSDYSCKKTSNQKDKTMDSYNQAHSKSIKLQQQIFLTQQDINYLKKQKFQLNRKIDICKKNIDQQKRNCNQLDQKVKKLKLDLMHQEKQRNLVKADLQRQLKVMTSASIYSKELENQRANVLLEINKFVKESKI